MNKWRFSIVSLALLFACSSVDSPSQPNNQSNWQGWWLELGGVEIEVAANLVVRSDTFWYAEDSTFGIPGILHTSSNLVAEYHVNGTCYSGLVDTIKSQSGNRFSFDPYLPGDDEQYSYQFAGETLIIDYKECSAIGNCSDWSSERIFYVPYIGDFPPAGWPSDTCLN